MVDSSTQTPRDENNAKDKEELTVEDEENTKENNPGKTSRKEIVFFFVSGTGPTIFQLNDKPNKLIDDRKWFLLLYTVQERGNLLWETLLVIGERRLLPWHFDLQKIKSFKILPIVTLRECHHQRPENPVNFLKTTLIEFLGMSLAPFSLISQLVKRSEIAPAEREKWETWVGSRMKGSLGLEFFTRLDPTQISLIFSFLCYYRAVCYRVLRCKRSAWNRL